MPLHRSQIAKCQIEFKNCILVLRKLSAFWLESAFWGPKNDFFFSSFPAVSTPIYATKYALESSLRDLQIPHSPRDPFFQARSLEEALRKDRDCSAEKETAKEEKGGERASVISMCRKLSSKHIPEDHLSTVAP